MAEFDLIAHIAARAVRRADVALGIGDDAAVLQPRPGEQLVACCDTLNVGVHFPHDAEAADIGWKSLAVNLSDLAAMGATPAWALLSLSLPRADTEFVSGFMEGFAALADSAGVALVGGDTTSGPLAITVTALGWVPHGQALLRSGAKVGDVVCVSGTLGDAAAALHLYQHGARCEAPAQTALRARMARPGPRLDLGVALRGVAHAAIDVSDGLLADLAHVARASGVGIELDAACLPASNALRSVFDGDDCRRFMAIGGDDYELAFTLTAAAFETLCQTWDRQTLPITRIGRVVEGSGVVLRDAEGQVIDYGRAGWEHFAGAGP